MVDRAGQQVGNRFLSAVRMIWESCSGLDAEMVEHEEGREVLELRRADRAANACACSFGLFSGEEGLLDLSRDGHVGRFRKSVDCPRREEGKSSESRRESCVGVGVELDGFEDVVFVCDRDEGDDDRKK